MTDYKLGAESNARVQAALDAFSANMKTRDIDSFLEALKAQNIGFTMDYDVSKINPDLVAFISFGNEDGEKKSSTVYLGKDINDFDLFFYLAHEAGHHMMHYECGREIPQFKSREKNYRANWNQLPKEEREADVFAYNILMPEKQFKHAFQVFNEMYNGDEVMTILNLSKLFFAGTEFVEERLEFLGMS